MVIWLRNPQHEGAAAGPGIGAEGDVLRGEQLATLVSIDTAWHAMRTQGEAELAAARSRAQALLDEAEARAAELEERAAQRYDNATREGYESGLREALADWHERVARGSSADGRTSQQRQRDRLAELVALAVEQMVAVSDPADLFRRAAFTLEQIVADGSPLEVRVHPADLRAATAAFGEAARGWREAGCAVRLRVHADASLEVGACLCESDLGAVDASLSLQLAATRAALARAVNSIADDAHEDDAHLEAGSAAPVCPDGSDDGVDANADADADASAEDSGDNGDWDDAANAGSARYVDAPYAFAGADMPECTFTEPSGAAHVAAPAEGTLHDA